MMTVTDQIRAQARLRRLPPPALAREIRRAAGLSQTELAAILGVHRVTLARYEAGMRQPAGGFAQRYAEALEAMQAEAAR